MGGGKGKGLLNTFLWIWIYIYIYVLNISKRILKDLDMQAVSILKEKEEKWFSLILFCSPTEIFIIWHVIFF